MPTLSPSRSPLVLVLSLGGGVWVGCCPPGSVPLFGGGCFCVGGGLGFRVPVPQTPPFLPQGCQVLAAKTPRNDGLARGPQGALGLLMRFTGADAFAPCSRLSASGVPRLGSRLYACPRLGPLFWFTRACSPRLVRFSRGACGPTELMRKGHCY